MIRGVRYIPKGDGFDVCVLVGHIEPAVQYADHRRLVVWRGWVAKKNNRIVARVQTKLDATRVLVEQASDHHSGSGT